MARYQWERVACDKICRCFRQKVGELLLANERVTEDYVEALLREQGYYLDPETVRVEKQQSSVASIKSALSRASKTQGGGAGYPEFIVTTASAPDLVVVIECKAEVQKHESPGWDKPADYAVDGVLHYAKFLTSTYTVVAIAVSGDEAASKWSIMLIPKGQSKPKELIAPTGTVIDHLVPMDDLERAASFDPAVLEKRTLDLIQFSQEMHEFMRDEAELEEKEKPLVVAGSLIALRNKVFANTYVEYPAADLPTFWMQTIKNEITKASLPVSKVDNMTQPFSAIEVHPELRKAHKAYPKGLLSEIVTMLAEHVLPFMTVYNDFDVVGQFYGEFLKYTGGDGKGLGIVLTPRHITELFALIANVNKDSIVIDPCAGTGGFLISAMLKMIATASTTAEVESIKRKQLIGVEQQSTMYALCASNMILRGDGKANLYQGSCFDAAITDAVKDHRPDVGLINPPYAKSKEDLHELRFVEHMLDSLKKGGAGVAIVPISCATAPSMHKENLLRKHTLEAVMSMPPDLFHPVGVVTCIMVFTAGVPHSYSDRKTWFGYWRNDGFVKVKKLGRVDRNQTWENIRTRWVASFRNREVLPGESVTATVGPEDEWVAEAYMETDYSTLTQEAFEKVMLDYALFTLGQSNSEGKHE